VVQEAVTQIVLVVQIVNSSAINDPVLHRPGARMARDTGVHCFTYVSPIYRYASVRVFCPFYQSPRNSQRRRYQDQLRPGAKTPSPFYIGFAIWLYYVSTNH
jgi:hypothetical protein